MEEVGFDDAAFGPGFVESEAVPLMQKMAHFQVKA